MKLFANSNSIFEEIRVLEKEEEPRQQDRATVSAFFNGQPPLSQAQAEAMGLKVNVNNLFGYTDLDNAKKQTLALYTKPPRLFNIELDSAPVGKKHEWEQKVSAAFNRRLKKSGRLKLPYEGAAGDATLHGEGSFFFPDPKTPYPSHLELAKRLIPSDSPADPRELSHFAVKGAISVFDLMKHIRREHEGWKLGALRKLVKSIFDDVKPNNDWSPRAFGAIETMNPEELEYARQEQSSVDRKYRFKVPCWYFYQADPERDGRPLDLSIVTTIGKPNSDDKEYTVLFEQEECFPKVTDAIQPFFMDCILGGSPKWHRVKGPGHLNYSVAWHIELLINRLMQGSMDSMMDIWQAADSANRETLEKILLTHNGIVPEGVSLLEKRRSIDFNGLLQVLNVFRGAAAKNSLDGVADQGDQELEVQALFRQGQVTNQQSNRHANWYDSLSYLGGTMFARFTCPDIHSSDPFYSEIMEFQSEVQRAGISLYYLQPHNVNVTAYRITGDGNDLKAQRSASFFMQNMAMYSAEAQQVLKRRVTAIMADDYDLAETLVPIEQRPDTEQLRIADGENNTCILQGRPPQIAASDIDETHVQTHLAGLQSMLEKAVQYQSQAFTPDQLAGFKALGAHTVAHIQRMEAMQKAEPARAAMEQLNEFARMGEKLAHNMEQMMQAQQEQPQIDPVDAAKLQLEERKIGIAERKTQFGEYKFERQQTAKENQQAITANTTFGRDAREEEAHRADLADRDTRLALDIAAAAKPGETPAQ